MTLERSRRQFRASISLAALMVLVPAHASNQETLRRTVLGLHNPQSPESARDLGAKAVRVLVSLREIDAGIPRVVERIASYKRLGFIVIVTFKEWNGPKRAPLPPVDSAEWTRRLDRFDALLRAAGPSLDYAVLDNEPMFDLAETDLHPARGGPAPAVAWYRALAQRASVAKTSEPTLSQVRITAPALNNVNREALGVAHLTRDSLNMLLDWEIHDPHVDAVDIHLHVATVREIDAAAAFMRGKTQKPLIVTEWSQNEAARSWLGQALDPEFVRKWNVGQASTNQAFIKACYGHAVEKSEWDEFVAKAPYDPAFMKDAFAAMVRREVAVATYGGGAQFGDSAYDSKQLMANMTVVPGPNGKPQENYLFATWYRSLAAQESGR